jgi:hypothetical protein
MHAMKLAYTIHITRIEVNRIKLLFSTNVLSQTFTINVIDMVKNTQHFESDLQNY